VGQGAAVTAQLEQVRVLTGPDTGARKPLNPAAMTVLAGLPHVRAAWGQVILQGAFSGSAEPSALVSLPPKDSGPAGMDLASGRAPRSDDAAEVVISVAQARRLGMDTRTALGRTLQFRGAYNGIAPAGATAAAKQPALDLTVVGLSRSAPLAGDLDGGAVPYATAVNYWTALAVANGWTGDAFQSGTLLADSTASTTAVRDEARAAGYAAETPDGGGQAVQQLLGNLSLALVGLALVALIVASLGILNTMYTAVLERTREIGVLKAIGARARDIRLVFVAEAAVIGAAGGAVGVVAAALSGRIGNQALSGLKYGQASAVDVHLFQFTPWLAVAGIVLAIVFSLLSGLLPAIRASIQDPAAALHWE
jgi:hypothetical protein